eukprot:6204999-Pleurochrysis_carterae.AAC.3
MVRCSAEWRCPAARAPASARAAARATPRSAGVDLAMEGNMVWRCAASAARPGAAGARPSSGRTSLLGAKASASSTLGGRSAPAAGRSARAVSGVTGRVPPVKKAKRAASAEAQTKKCASPPGCAGLQPRASVSAQRSAARASLTASCRKAHARRDSGMRCALMPSAAATSVITASYPRLATSARIRASP